MEFVCESCKGKPAWVVTTDYSIEKGKGAEHFVCGKHVTKYFELKPRDPTLPDGRHTWYPKQERSGLARFRVHRYF